MLIGNIAHFTNIQGALSGGNNYTQFTVGGGYTRQGTVFPGDFLDQKASGHFNLTHSSVNRKFNAQFVTSYVKDNNVLPITNYTALITLAPNNPSLYDKLGNVNWGMYSGYGTFSNNPVGKARQRTTSSTDNLISNLNLRYLVLPGLELKSSFGYNRDQMNQIQLIPANSYAPPNDNLSSNRANVFATTSFSSWIIEPQISYQKEIRHFGRLELLAGSTYQQNNVNSLTQSALGFTSDALIRNPQAATTQTLLGSVYTQYKYTATYGRIGYNWQDKYLINLTARRDGSSRFGPGKQFGNFGAIGAAWVFSKEKFAQDGLSFLSFGKLRGSYGTTGNDQITDYQFLSTYSVPNSLTYQGMTGLAPTRLTNPFFAWEVVKKLEAGLDIGLFNDRILLSASYYRNRTGNQLVGYPLPSQTGFSSVQYNLPAVVQNSGEEFVLTTLNIRSKNFEWTSVANLTIPTNKLISYPGLAGSSYATQYVIGKSLFIQKLYHNTGVNPQTGLYSFATKNVNGVPSNPQDRVVLKNVTQRFYGGIQNRFTYKGFTLDVFFQYVNQLGYSWQSAFATAAGWANYNLPTAVLGRWKHTGDFTAIQRFGTGSAVSNTRSLFVASDNNITDASFLRVKNLVVSYQLPDNWKTRAHLQSAKIYIQCQNLFTITHYIGLDPETSGNLNLPQIRMVTVGLQVGL